MSWTVCVILILKTLSVNYQRIRAIRKLPDALTLLMASCSNFLYSMDALPGFVWQMACDMLSLVESLN